MALLILVRASLTSSVTGTAASVTDTPIGQAQFFGVQGAGGSPYGVGYCACHRDDERQTDA